MDTVTTHDAAERLGVSDVAVRKMLKSGRLIPAGRAGRTILIDPASLHRAADLGHRKGRLWSPRTAWATLCLLSGRDAPWVESAERYRIKVRLKNLEPTQVHQLSRNRAAVKRYRATPTAVEVLQQALIATAGSALRIDEVAARFGLAAGEGFVDGYARPGDSERFAAALGMTEDPSGNAIIREAPLAQPFEQQDAPIAVIAVDLMDSLAERERSAGARLLDSLLHG